MCVLPGLNSPVRLDVFESQLFWVSEQDGTLTTMDKFGRGVNRTLQSGLERPHAVTLFHRYKHDIASTHHPAPIQYTVQHEMPLTLSL